MTSSSATPMPPRISAMENMLGRTPRVIARPDSVPIEMADIVNEDPAKLFNSLSLVMGFCAALTVYEGRKGDLSRIFKVTGSEYLACESFFERFL